jgi:hypothetical protein
VEVATGPFSVRTTSRSFGEDTEDDSLFPSVMSVLSINLDNLTHEEVLELQFGNISCVADENIAGPSVFASTQIIIECKFQKQL